MVSINPILVRIFIYMGTYWSNFKEQLYDVYNVNFDTSTGPVKINLIKKDNVILLILKNYMSFYVKYL